MIAGCSADQLVFETRNGAARAQYDLAVLTAGARNLLVVNPPLSVDEQDVAGFGRALRNLRLALLLGDPLDCPVDLLVWNFDNESLDTEIGEARFRDLR